MFFLSSSNDSKVRHVLGVMINSDIIAITRRSRLYIACFLYHKTVVG